jgi:hypothetical protein
MTIVAEIMAAGCSVDLPSSAGEGAAGPEQQHASEPLVSPLETANVLIFGDQIVQMNVLRGRLQELGHTVAIRPGFQLPSTVEELAQFQTVWHVGRNVPLTPAQQALLIEYLSIGGAVHLTGESSGAAASNASLTTFVRSVVKHGNGITIGNPNTVPGRATLEMLDVGGITGSRPPRPAHWSSVASTAKGLWARSGAARIWWPMRASSRSSWMPTGCSGRMESTTIAS